MITLYDIKTQNISHKELDELEYRKVFDVSYEVGGNIFYFRLSKGYTSMEDFNTIEFLEESSDTITDEALQEIKNRLTNLYL